ncbi:hypothetical protein [Streptomyces sp. NPDC059008]|uniref:hypothetical protein n=1 Tax=Streptomyces sp. NPDC059008 TaxID=3346693 RepID=UPI0036B71CB9
MLDGLDAAWEESRRGRRRTRRCPIGWRQILAQILYVAAVTTFMISVLVSTRAAP